MAILLLLFSILCFTGVGAQNSLPPFSSPFSLHQATAMDAGLNPAAASRLTRTEASVYSERKAMLPELQDYSLYLGIAAVKGFIYSSLFYSGFEGYKQTKISLGYGRALGDIAIGSSISFETRNVHSYIPEKRIGAKTGMLMKMGSQWNGGFTVSYSDGDKEGFRYSGGVGLDLSSSLHFFILFHNWQYGPVSLLGIRMKEDKLLLSFSFDPTQHFFQLGGGVRMAPFSLGIQTGYQPFLGFTPSLFLQFRKENE